MIYLCTVHRLIKKLLLSKCIYSIKFSTTSDIPTQLEELGTLATLQNGEERSREKKTVKCALFFVYFN